MPEVQSHGFSWQNDIFPIYGASTEEIESIPYTSKMDLPASMNRVTGCDLSIKTAGQKNAVCMADCLRIYDAVESPLHMILIRYKQIKNIKRLVSIIEIDLTNSRELLFGSLTREQIKTLDDAVKSVDQKKKPTPEQHKHMYDIKKSLQKMSGLISLNIKCNSTQSRLQCSIPYKGFETFIKNNPNRIIEKSDTNEFRGGKLTYEIESSCRTFNPKPK
jgi:hypothetical protein